MRHRRIVIYLIIAICFTLGVWSYETKDKEIAITQQEKKENKRIVIGATLASEDSEYLKSVTHYMKEAATEKDIELILKYADWDVQVQTKQLDEFIAQKVDAIILCPTNAKSLLTPLKRVREADIPVINLNMQVDAISLQYITTYVGASSSEEAALAAELFIEALGEKGGEIAIIEGAPGSDAQIFRTQTFVEKLAAYPQIEIVGIGNGNWERRKAKLVAKDLIHKNPQLKGIFAHDSNMAMGILEAIEELEIKEEIYVVGVSESEEYLEALHKGKLYGIITQPPDYEGKYSVYCAIMAAQGIRLRPWYKDPIQILKKEDVTSFKRTME
ncbi:hypothetical protein CS063_14670 [Sporanaerobium hydrogeniformans]|uniref:Uncharacterized protein n=1 Tax=Sporanaerobium hydrogeniformans TaxID=3072179 RepID=A0AC61D9B3_9FIRM|nr:sugar ABC transporter substrate-binding protein [Sporanaerobium hydrogeniformans]PHV69663.1 hypothetical protein CS063_14670 [Sporanaerobium hydrogeniformans]